MVNDSTNFGINVRHSQHISGDVSAYNYLVNGEISLGGPTNASQLNFGQNPTNQQASGPSILVPNRIMEASPLGSDPFSLLPIIEQNSRRKKKQRRACKRRSENTRVGVSRETSPNGSANTLLGKRCIREDENVSEGPLSRRRMVPNEVSSMLSATMDEDQSCRHQ
ncbi:hypothetical protein ACFX2C_003443 [Malus domestica]